MFFNTTKYFIVLITKYKKVALCGSDINLYKWNETAKVIASLPFTPGKYYLVFKEE